MASNAACVSLRHKNAWSCYGLRLTCALWAVPVQLPLLKERWRVILAGACFQYAHGMATQLAHRMHHPLAQPLHDVGFDLLPVCAPPVCGF